MAWQDELPDQITKPLKISDTYKGLECWAFVPGYGFLQVRCTDNPVSQQKRDPLGGHGSRPRMLVLWQQVCVPEGSTWRGMATGIPSQIHQQQWKHQEDEMDPLFWVDPVQYKPPRLIREPITMKHN